MAGPRAQDLGTTGAVRLQPAAHRMPDPVPLPSPARPQRRKRRVPVFMILLLAVALWVAMNPSAAQRAALSVAEKLKLPVQSLEGESDLRNATSALDTQWKELGHYDADPEKLEELDSGVHWGDVVVVRPCFDGRAAVVTAKTIRGTVSRLLAAGDDKGDVAGDQRCPPGLGDLGPWADRPQRS